MRLINRLWAVMLMAATLAVVGCEKPAPQPTEKPMAVTYSALDGAWQLTMWQGTELAEDTYLYIEFDRSSRHYTMWDNIDSMYATDTTGTFTITEEEDGTYTLSGTYDYGVGDWSNDYRVVLTHGGDHMQWRALSANQTMDFVRVEAIPEFN